MGKPLKEDEDELPDVTVSEEDIRAAQEAVRQEDAETMPLCPGCGMPLHDGDCTDG